MGLLRKGGFKLLGDVHGERFGRAMSRTRAPMHPTWTLIKVAMILWLCSAFFWRCGAP
jgi:hypothetical protein